jgi:pimeloyl-ACP methyl ester carboxylesterase
MFNEKAFIGLVEQADPEEFSDILTRPTGEEELALRWHLGDERYQRMHQMALRRASIRAVRPVKGQVVVVHASMGSELTAVERTGGTTHLWVNAPRIMDGQLDRLRLDEEGRGPHSSADTIRVTGMMKRHYGELLLGVARDWDVRAFCYDWRKDVRLAAAQLAAQLRAWFSDGTAVSFVAHGMGGLIVRRLVHDYPDHWRSCRGGGEIVGRLIMLGTPNYGSFALPQLLAGIDPMLRRLDLLDSTNDLSALRAIFNSFPGLYQMLPSPRVAGDVEDLYRADSYAPVPVSQRHLGAARRQHEELHEVVDRDRMICVAGYGQPTITGITDLRRLGNLGSYKVTLDGDGYVPLALGPLRADDGSDLVPTFYLDETQGDLTSNETVLAALNELLERGSTSLLGQRPRSARRLAKAAREGLKDTEQSDDEALQVHAQRLGARSGGGQPMRFVTFDERQAEEHITRNFFSARTGLVAPKRIEVDILPAHIELAILHRRLEELGGLELEGQPAIDVVAVGHYVGVRPQAAELALDRMISGDLARRGGQSGGVEQNKENLLLTQYSERGIIQGELGQPFFVNLPRDAEGTQGDLTYAIAGMGVPGRFGAPELTVLARELCWSLGRLGKRHLATVLIGAGNGNLPEAEAVAAWIRGIKYALSGSADDQQPRLRRITFVEQDPRKIRLVQHAILEEQRQLKQKNRLIIAYEPIPEDEIKRWIRADAERRLEQAKTELDREPEERSRQDEDAATRITLSLEGRAYRFGAITKTASVPERRIELDPHLVEEANDELAAEWEPSMQVERGQFLERLLIPADLRMQLYAHGPIVMLLDATTARIHWELVAQPELTSLTAPNGLDAGSGRSATDTDAAEQRFLGTSRGLTRQLRTTFAPPPEPPPPPRRVLRALIVADPAEDMRLPQAQAEGVAVNDLLTAFNRVYPQPDGNRIDVVTLLGPREATRTNVLRHLMLHSYDVMHFAGHCIYDKDSPPDSGWIFTGGARLTANEFSRVDRIPKFVFSNACESGITPDRSQDRSVAFAPSFAESFFARGVSNFVCTAWPVDDTAARVFALQLYADLLGLLLPDDGSPVSQSTGRPQLMHVAMCNARLKVAREFSGARTWGAYQHYGNPYLRFFDPTTLRAATTVVEPGSQPGPGPSSKRPPAKIRRNR